VSRLEPVSGWTRLRAVLGGDFTPLHIAEIEFTSLVLPDGRRVELHTAETVGLNSLVPLKPPKPAPTPQTGNGGILGTGKQKVKEQIDARVEQIKGIPDMVRGTGTKELLYDYALSRLPYHPQYIHNRTRFDAELSASLSFGTAKLAPDALGLLGSQPAEGAVAHARLVTSVDSLHSRAGENVEAVLEQPLFSADHKLLLPEGTIVRGSVGMAKKAGWFHHAGRLRFAFQSIELTPDVVRLESTARQAPSAASTTQRLPEFQLRTQAVLHGAEGATAPVKVDSEGGVQAKESKTRFIGTAAAILIARSAADNDEGRHHVEANGPDSNISGRTLGGGLGFGLLGSVAAQASNNVGAALGYYGMAWSVFSTVVARGPEVEFKRNSAIDVGFNPRTAAK
jgi:hypothetical protein